MTNNLVFITEVAGDDSVPMMWKVYGAADKKEVLTMMQEVLDNRANKVESTRVSPVLTPELYGRFTSGQFAPRTTRDLTGGFSIYLVMPTMSVGAADKQACTQAYQLVYSGSNAPSMAQLAELISEAPDMPRTGLAYVSQNKTYVMLLDTIFEIRPSSSCVLLHRIPTGFGTGHQ